MKNTIPTQKDNPLGLHSRYYIQKIVRNPDYENRITDTFMGEDNTPEFVLKDVDKGAEYFVMRLDDGGSDPKHISACRIGVNAYADAIEDHLPELAKDLRKRYPLKKNEKKSLKQSTIEAFQMLYYGGLLNDKEKESIQKKINTKYR